MGRPPVFCLRAAGIGENRRPLLHRAGQIGKPPQKKAFGPVGPNAFFLPLGPWPAGAPMYPHSPKRNFKKSIPTTPGTPSTAEAPQV